MAQRAGGVLETFLRDLLVTLDARRNEQLGELRASAQELLGLRLAATPDSVTLVPGRGFWFDFAPAPAWEPPGAELVRRFGPGALRRARQRVLADVPGQVDKQVGRARADLQHRLAETVRDIRARLRDTHQAALRRMATAVAQAQATGAAESTIRDARRADLAGRLVRLDGLIDRLHAAP